MSKLKCCIVGLGSMGKRRARLLKQLDENYLLVGVDKRSDRRLGFKKLFAATVFDDIDTALKQEKCDCAFICTSPLHHAAVKAKLDTYNLHTFSEINLISDGYANVFDKPESRSFLSSTSLYSQEVITLQTLLSEAEKYFYTYHVGQYLPDWHPWDKKEDFFVFDKRTNGCREILAIELPWIVALFGHIKTIKVTSGNMSSMTISFPDVYHIILEHDNGTLGSLTVDVVSRSAVRDLKIQNETTFIAWDGNPNSMRRFNLDTQTFDIISLYKNVTHTHGYSNTIIEEPYLEEIKDFLLGIHDFNHKFKYSYQQDAYIVQILDRIEQVQ